MWKRGFRTVGRKSERKGGKSSVYTYVELSRNEKSQKFIKEKYLLKDLIDLKMHWSI